ncbi:efflux transporter outer membrane subunit [Hyphomonas sp.]|uniref:efflux transporter outer membrane subunit n=1 Tax=Hyphomonas sp. TaxID=87 RepID=UPI003919C2DA
MKTHHALAVLPGLLALSGCLSLAPAYERVPAPIPNDLPETETARGPAAPLRWDELVVAPPLRELIVLALQENRDLRATAANVRSARAQLMIARGETFPSVTASASGREGDMFDSSDAGVQSFSDSASVTAGTTAWELDFFGRIASNNEAALQTYLASAEGERAAKLALVSTLGEAWLQLAADRALLALAEDTVSSQSESLELTRALLDAGAANELDVRRASASVQTARAQAAQYVALVRQDLNLLRLLAGTDLPAGTAEAAQLTPLPVVSGGRVNAPSEILLDRPDIMAAEHQLRATNARIGAARAAFFPSISLTGSAGYVSSDLTDLVGGDGAGGWSFGPNISLPIFDGGVRKGNLGAANSARDAALAQYESAIQSAFRETADALAVSGTIDARLDALTRLVEDTDVTLSLSKERFRSGVDGYLSVLDAQRENYSSRQQLIAARLDQGRNAIALFRALGNWDEE